MFKALESLKIRLAVRIGWSLPGRLPEAIRGFQATEADGVWHLHRGLARISDPRQKMTVFLHSLEEESHAEEFGAAYDHYGQRVRAPATYERKDLYEPSAAAWKTFAFVHVGEVDATERFRQIHRALGEGVLRSSLERIVTDEDGHVDLTDRMLVEMGAKPREIAREVRKIRLLRLWEHWLRMGRNVVDVLAVVLLSAAYFLVGPFLAAAAREKLRRRFVDFDNSAFKRL